MAEKVVITIDTREKDKEFIDYLKRFGAELKFEAMPIGDIGIFGEKKSYVIERKSVNDLGNSIGDRLFEQIKVLVENAELGEVPYIPCYLVIGYVFKLYKNRGFAEKQIAKIENAIQFGWNLKYIKAHNNRMAAQRVIGLAESIQQPKESKLHPMRHVKRKGMTLEEEARYVIEGFPALGPTRAQQILEYYGTVDAAFEAMKVGTIKEISGIGDKVADAVQKVFNYGPDIKAK